MISRRSTILSATALAASLLIVGGGVAMAGDGTSTAPQATAAATVTTFTVVERATSDTIVFVNPSKNDVIGNTLGFGNALYNATNAKKVGRDQGFCYRTNPGMSWECTWTNLLPGGAITVQGVFLDSGADSRLAVTGGTGRYARARGYMVLHSRNPAGTAYNFEFHLM
jgi:hypothetical protein